MSEPTPRDYQWEGIDFLWRVGRCILGDDMGLGKTPQSIWACRKSGAKVVLIVCKKTLRFHWKNQLKKFWPQAIVAVPTGPLVERAKIMQGFPLTEGRWADKPQILIITPDMLWNENIQLVLRSKTWDVLVVDEAHRFHNRKANWTKALGQVSRSSRRVFLLTGTAIQNRVSELWSLCNILFPKKYTSYWRFVDDTKGGFTKVEKDKWGHYKVSDYCTRPDALRQEITPFFLRRERADVQDLPPRVDTIQVVEMEGEQERIYREMEDEQVAKLIDEGKIERGENGETFVIASIKLAEITYLQEITITPELIGGPRGGAKIDALLEIIQSTDGKVVFCSQFSRAIEICERELKKAGIKGTGFTGKVKDDEERFRRTQIFNEDPSMRWFGTTLGAGGEGIDLTGANLMVFLDKHWNPQLNEQMVARIYRDGQKKTCFIIELQAMNSVEQWKDKKLDGKIKTFDSVIAVEKGRIPISENKEVR